MIRTIKFILTISICLISTTRVTAAQMSDLERAIAESKKTAAAEAAIRSQRHAEHKKRKQEDIDIEIQQLKVLAQKNADCGFHAVKNVNILLNWLRPKLHIGVKDRDLMLNSNDIQIFPLEKMRNKTDSKTAIYSDEIEKLAAEFYKIPKKKFSIIQNIFQIEKNLLSKKPEFSAVNYIDPDLGTGIKKLREFQRAVHGFIIADARFNKEKDGTFTGQAGHWISIVALKENNKIYLFCTDSASGDTVHNNLKMAQTLSNIILNSNYNALTAAAKGKKIKCG